MMVLAMLLACSPLRRVAADEAVWWGPTEALEQAVSIDLVDLPAGEPIDYWPRISIYRDRIEVDNRAWYLSLPPTARDGVDGAARLVEPTLVVSLDGGHLAEDQMRGQLISSLYDVLLEMAEARKDLAMRTGDERLEFDGQLALVADASTPMTLVQEVIFTAGQAQYGRLSLVGAAEGRGSTRLSAQVMKSTSGD